MMLLTSPDAIRERVLRCSNNFPDCSRATGSVGMGWVGWTTLFTSTTVNSVWVKRHPPYRSE